MKRLTILCIIAFVGLIVVPATVIAAGPPGGLDVNVVNPIPLPVTGDINATVTGDVNVINTDPIPIQNVDRPANQPVVEAILPILHEGMKRTISPLKILTVPAGKLLIIEHISLFSWGSGCQDPPDTGVAMIIYAKLSTGGPRIPHGMSIAKVLLDPDEIDEQHSIYSLSQPVRIYAGPETDVEVNLIRNHPVGDCNQVYTVTISGYYVDN